MHACLTGYTPAFYPVTIKTLVHPLSALYNPLLPHGVTLKRSDYSGIFMVQHPGKILTATLIAALLALTIACGQKGPLKMPEPTPDQGETPSTRPDAFAGQTDVESND